VSIGKRHDVIVIRERWRKEKHKASRKEN